MDGEILLSAVPSSLNAIDSCGNCCSQRRFLRHGGYIEIGKKHGAEEDFLHQGRWQTQGAADFF
jgi:hypothetical protein